MTDMGEGAFGDAAKLRKQAEATATKHSPLLPENLESLPPKVIKKLFHELQVHQIELEMQNEELRRTQAELDSTRQRYFDLYDLAPVGYVTVSEQGLILEANLTAAGMLGAIRGALVHQPLPRFILKDDQDLYYRHRKQLFETGEQQAWDLRMVKKDGTPFWVHLQAGITQDAGGASICRLVMSDITELVATLGVLNEKNQELETAIQVADKANHAKSEFLSSMSHELRTPLNAILGFAQLLDTAAPPATPVQKANIEQILQAGWYLLELINQILDLAVVESGRVSLSEDPVSLGEVMCDCQSMVEAQDRSRGIHFSFPVIAVPAFIHADRLRLKQVLINLLSNATKYNKPEGTVTVECTEINPGRIRISVRDSGPGISKEHLKHLFEPFNRLGQEYGPEQGTGIGLVMSKLLVQLMGGVMGVESTVGEGSVFWLELNRSGPPAFLDSRTESAPGQLEADTVPTAPSAPKVRTVLYIEDNPANLELVERLLGRRSDLVFLSAGDATLGLALARKHLPDVILMDINLPGINGVQAMKVFQGDEATSGIPVLAVSANAMAADVTAGLEAGFFRYLTKPFDLQKFMATIDEALDSRKQPS